MEKEEIHRIAQSLNKYYDLGHFFDSNLGLLCIADTDGYFRKLNPEWERVLGYNLSELEKFIEFVHPDDVDRTLEVLSKLSQKIDVENFKNRYRCKDGSYRWIEWRSTTAKEGLIYAIGTDITEKIKTEERLRNSEERYRKITSTITDYIYTVYLKNGNPVKTIHGPGCIAVTGYSEEEFEQDPYLWIRIVYPDDRSIVEKHAKNLEKGIESSPIEHRIFHKNGEIRWVQNTPVLHYNEEGNLLSYDGLIKDITERKKTEIALKESEEKYRLMIENANDAIFIVQEGFIKFPNRRSIDISGYSEEELTRTPFHNFIYQDDKDIVLNIHRKRLSGLEVPATYSFRVLKRNGEIVWVEISAVLITWEGKPATLNFLRDITHQRRLEEQLLHAQKMEAIGTLAGGIAHNFNNLLMGILGYTSLMLLKTDENHPFYKKLKIIEKLVESGSELTRQLLGFAREGKYDSRTIDINDLIIETSEMFISTKKEITLQRNLQKDLYLVEADRGQIEQVLINIYLNAWQAMPSGGKLYIETQNIFLDENESVTYDLNPGKYVKINITDTGTGMDEDTVRRIFEPFFTTKGPGEGTGLGLASAYGIIKNHGGTIKVYSEKGHGTTFTIYLPSSDKEVLQKHAPVDLKPYEGDETILIVDDEKISTEAVRELLGALGYKVLTVKSGREALEIYKSNLKEIKLVILDMIMPDMSGKETFEKLMEMNKNLKVLLSSGYSINGEALKLLKMGCKGFIQKPFRVEELTRKIREILDE